MGAHLIGRELGVGLEGKSRMSVWSDFKERVRTLLMRSREERELSDEIAFHLEMETRKNIDAGMSATDARRVAELALGGSEKVKEEVRDARGTRHLENVWRDASVAIRTLAKNPDFSLIMLLILALGIGANTTTFTLVDALLLSKLPVEKPDQLIVLGDASRPNTMSLGTPRTDLASYPLFEDIRDASGSLVKGMYATGRGARIDVLLNETGGLDEKPEHPRSRFVSGSYFSVLGVRTFAGRTFTAVEDRIPGGDPYVVISYDYWQQKLGANRNVIGRTITINKVPFTIVGIAQQGFTGDIVGQPTDMWIPMMMQPLVVPTRQVLDDRSASWILIVGRLAPGVTEEKARTVFRAVHKQALTANATVEDAGAIADRLKDTPLAVENGARGISYYRNAYSRSLFTLMVAVSLVLLVVCANVANLMLVRAVGRTREMGVRMAIGAGRG